MINDFCLGVLWFLRINLLPLILALSILPLAAFAQAPAGTSPMKIGIIGSGNIGSTVGDVVGEGWTSGVVFLAQSRKS